jgi:hemerythrin superfamily protein
MFCEITKDHSELKQLFTKCKEQTDTEAKKQILESIVQLLKAHNSAEEHVVYPLFEKTLPFGASIYDKSISEHKEVDNVRSNNYKGLTVVDVRRTQEDASDRRKV